MSGAAASMTDDDATRSRGRDVLIVIPCLNEARYIESVIRTLQSDPGCADALIVMADDGSRDDTVAIVERIGQSDPRVRALASDAHRGISAVINRAVRRFGAGRRWLVRIDAHAEYPPCYASKLVRKAVETGAASVATPMVTKGTSCFQEATAAAQNSVLGTGGAAHRVTGRGGGWVDHGHHALMRLDLFTRIGGYDESFTHNEDAELDRRIGLAGGRIWLAEELALVYYPRGSSRSLFRQYFYYGRGRAMTLARHGGKRHWRQVAPLAVAPAVALALLSPLAWPLVLPAAGWALACLGLGLTLGSRSSPCAYAAGYPAMLMHLAWSMGYWKQVILGPRPGAAPEPLSLAQEDAVDGALQRRAG
jgi:succinoglycan biosynthesis protein ExoA